MKLKRNTKNGQTCNYTTIYSKVGDFFKYSFSTIPREEKLWRCFISDSRKRYKRIMIENNLIIEG